MAEQSGPSPASRWTSRLAFFSAVLVVFAFLLHRLFGMPTPVAFNIVAAAYLCAIAALLTGVLAAAGIWRSGGSGTARVVSGLVISGAMLAGPLALLVLAREHPPLNDISTDTASPPEYAELAKLRTAGANPASYRTEELAAVQKESFPDLETMILPRPAEEAFEIVTEAVNRQRMSIVNSEPPGEGRNAPGLLEAIDRTLIAGFYDDVVIRVAGEEDRALVDIRSSSRYGVYDFGRNADRVRGLMREIAARLEANLPVADGEAGKDGKKGDKPGLKSGKDDDQKRADRRKQRDRERSDSRRERKQRVPPPE